MASEVRPSGPAATAGDEPVQQSTGAGLSLPLWGVVVAAGLVLVCAGLKEIADIIAPIFLMVTLVITVHPLRKVLLRWHFPRWVASLVVLIVIYLMMAMILGAVALSVTQLALQLPNYQKAFEGGYTWALGILHQLGVNTNDWRGMLSKIDIGSFTGAAQGVLSGVTSAFSLVGLMAITVIFLAFDAAGVRERMAIIQRVKPTVAAAFSDFSHRVRSYWIVTTVFGLIVAFFDVIALAILNVPLALTWGVLAFVSNYIPNVGFIIGIIPPVAIALLQSGPGTAIAVVIAYCVINFVIQTLIQPRFTGDAVGINPSVAFISLIFWAAILGPLGALLAVPATLFIKVILIDHSPNAQWFGALISSGGDDKPPKKKTGRWSARKRPEPAAEKSVAEQEIVEQPGVEQPVEG